MNTVNLIGNLTRDPELRYSQSGTAVASCNIAVQRRFKNQNGDYESDFINIKAFSKTAELLAEHFRKGSKLGITGNIQTGNYENQQGQKVYTTDVVVEIITFVERKNSDSSQYKSDTGVSNGNNGNYAKKNQNATQTNLGASPMDKYDDQFSVSSDDLPF